MAVVIVGAGPGLGAALADRFSRDGSKVALIARSDATLASVTSRETLKGRDIAAFTADAGDETALGQALDAAIAWGDEPSVLIYNAAAFNAAPAADLPKADLAQDLNVNLLGAVQSVNRVLPAMLERNSGTILLTGGGLALNPAEAWASLAVGKAALRAYAHALAKSVGPKGIHAATVTICGLIEPGGDFDPDLIAQSYWDLHSQPAGDFAPEIIFSPEGSDKNYNESN